MAINKIFAKTNDLAEPTEIIEKNLWCWHPYIYQLTKELKLFSYNITRLKADPTKSSNTLKQFVSNSNCLRVFDYFVGSGFKGLYNNSKVMPENWIYS